MKTSLDDLPFRRRFDRPEFERLVGKALIDYRSSLSLARSPLAASHLVTPALILDPIAPTTEERAVALRLALRWAVSKVAPVPNQYSFGIHRSFDDPTWSNPNWWHYNILRHKFIEPIHPDDFVDGARETGTIIALTGIPSTATFFREQSRAIQEVAGWLMQQNTDGEADTELRHLALQEVRSELLRIQGARQVAEIASTFSEVFSRPLLVDLAQSEGIDDPEWTINELLRRRYLFSSDSLAHLWMSPVFRDYLHANQDKNALHRRHWQIAEYYLDSSNDAMAARHLHAAGKYSRAASVLLDATPEYLGDLDIDDLFATLEQFSRSQLDDNQWYDIQLLLSDLYQMTGEPARAIVTSRAALSESTDTRRRGIIYHRLGKLYERLNQSHAMTYYQQAYSYLKSEGYELAELLKDRGWLYIFRDELDTAMRDLTLAFQKLKQTTRSRETLSADIYDAMAVVHKRRRDYDAALKYGRYALRLREEFGNPLLVAKSHANLAWIYYEQENYDNALSAFSEAAETFRRLNNQRLLLDMMINIGIVHHASRELSEALKIYQVCHQSSIEIEDDMKLAVSKINLAEILAELGEEDEAILHWKDAYSLSLKNSFYGEIHYLEKLRMRFQLFQLVDLSEFQRATLDSQGVIRESTQSPMTNTVYDYEEDTILAIARTHGYVTTRLVVEHMPISRATATRKLTAMVARSLLERQGKGRGTRYAAKGIYAEEADRPRLTDRSRSGLSMFLAQVKEYRMLLEQQHSLAMLSIVDEADDVRQYTMPAALNLLAEFIREPTLSEYFNLAAFLGELGGQQVHIIPFSVVSSWDKNVMLSRVHRIFP